MGRRIAADAIPAAHGQGGAVQSAQRDRRNLLREESARAGERANKILRTHLWTELARVLGSRIGSRGHQPGGIRIDPSEWADLLPETGKLERELTVNLFAQLVLAARGRN